jgi:L-amino acid N-acyltransferase YncA/DNA-binding transcriptional ArsR family regulator
MYIDYPYRTLSTGFDWRNHRAASIISGVSTSQTSPIALLPAADAATYAEWFACLAEPTRVRLLHAVAAAGRSVTVGELTEWVEISQSTCSHHLRKLADVGFVQLRRSGTTTLVTVNPACCTGLPHAADAVMGVLASRPCCPTGIPADVHVRALRPADWPDVRRIYAEGIATGDATFETDVPARQTLEAKWLPAHRWVAEVDGQVAGWAAASPVSTRDCYAGVAETSVYVGAGHRGRGVGKALLHKQVTAADADGLWTLQTSIFPENRPSLALHHTAGYRTLAVRERIARHHGRWRDTVLLERRRAELSGPA